MIWTSALLGNPRRFGIWRRGLAVPPGHSELQLSLFPGGKGPVALHVPGLALETSRLGPACTHFSFALRTFLSC